MPNPQGFYYVYIPCEDGNEIEERFFEGTCELQDDTFQTKLKQHFAIGNDKIDRKMLKEQMEGHAQSVGQSIGNIDDDVLEGLMHSTAVEMFPVLLPLKDTNYRGITAYLDNKGISKNLKRNDRVTSLIKSAGYPDQVFHGDVFIGSMFDDQDAWYRIDFKKSELNMEANWIKMVQRQKKNTNAGESMSQLQQMMAGQQQGVDGKVQDMQKMQQLMGGTTINESVAQEGECENYKWRDVDNEEIEITFKTECNKKDVKVIFKTEKVIVSLRGETAFDEKLFSKITPDECSWSVSDKKLCVTLMKCEEKTWSSLVA